MADSHAETRALLDERPDVEAVQAALAISAIVGGGIVSVVV